MTEHTKALLLADILQYKIPSMECLEEAAAELRRLDALNAEWERKAATWLASPEAAQRLDGYRELAQRVNALETLNAELVEALEKLADETPTTHVRVGKAIAEGKEHVALWFDDSTDPLQQALYLNATKPEKLKPLLKFFRAYLAEPEKEQQPEPVAWWHDMGDVVDLNVSGCGTPLYFAPPQREWVGLTDEEIRTAASLGIYEKPLIEFARAVEAKLKEKNASR